MKRIISEQKYKIVAYGPGKECLTWAGASNLEDTKEILEAQGYDVFEITKEDE